MVSRHTSTVAISVLSSVLATLLFFVLQQLTAADVPLFTVLKSLTTLVYVSLMYLYLLNLFLPDSEFIRYLQAEPSDRNKYFILVLLVCSILTSIALVASIPRNPAWAFYLLILFLHVLDHSISCFALNHNIIAASQGGLIGRAVHQQTIFGFFASIALLVLTVAYRDQLVLKVNYYPTMFLIFFNTLYLIPFCGFAATMFRSQTFNGTTPRTDSYEI